MNSSSFIPCEKSIQSVRDITWKSWKERLLAERLNERQKKLKRIFSKIIIIGKKRSGGCLQGILE